MINVWPKPATVHYLLLFVGLIDHLGQCSPMLYDATAIEVKISSGRIRGEYGSLEGENYAVFKGIPYAAPPVGAARFQAPIDPADWRGVMNATTFRSCLQNEERRKEHFLGINRKTKREEDCLFLNVFAPPKVGNVSYAVLVWIHGGGFQVGSSADFKQEPILRNFVSRKIIFVSLNYRLGPLGFASTGDDSLPGNFGLMDQIAALNWVQLNIVAFGGDPKSVTLAGQGSGASAASILALSPKADGLFHRIILLSGTAVSPGVVRETAVNATWALEGHLSCRASNSTQLLYCLRDNRPSSRLLDPNRPHVFYDDYYEYAPIIDKSSGIIPENIERLAQSRPKIPMMIGTTRDESAWHLMKVGRENLNMTSGLTKTQAEEAVRNLTSQFSAFTNHKLITEGCLYRYIYSLNDPATDWTVLRDGLLDLYSHFWFHAPASRLASLYDDSRVPVYLFSFDFTIRKSMLEREQWAFHGTDLIFLFDLETEFVSHYPDKEWQNDQRVTEIFSQLLTNFVKYNNPTPPNGGLVNWTRFQRNYMNYYSISHTPSMKVGFHWDGHSFWNDYARKLDSVDIGNLGYIAALKEELYQYKLATFMLLGCATLFLAILVGLGCYCTRKDPEEEDL